MNFKEVKSIYLQIAERLCDGILLGTYAEGERIPSVREYAATLEVNVNTVLRSYDYLSARGILSNRRGIGYSVADGAVAHIGQLRREAFMQEDLPQFFDQIDMLRISMDEIARLYAARAQKTSNEPLK